MSTSDRRCGDAGLSGPREACTADIESSTVTRWSRPPVRSLSERPSAGRISASSPVTTCERLSLVETCTVSSALRMAVLGHLRVRCGGDEVAAHPDEDPGLPVPQGLDRGHGVVPVLARRLEAELSRSESRKRSGGFSQMPIVRSPCTLEWPRTGHSPAPGLPMLPWSRARFTNSLIVATALRCWVIPIAQQVMVAAESRNIPAACSISDAARARSRAGRRPSRGLRACSAHSSKPMVCCSTNSLSTQPHSSSSAPIAWKSARSPLTRTGRNRSASPVPWPTMPRDLLRVLEAHQPGLAQRVDRDDLRAVLLRLLQRGEHPRVVGAGVLAGDHDQLGVVDVLEADTDPLPIPIASASATEVDSWHMFEQSGRLLVPKARTNSW